MLRARHVASAVSTGLSCTVHESERFRASTRAIRRWETSSGAPETGLEHCAWSPSARGCWAREAPTRKEASRGPWVGGWWHGRGGVWGWRARWGCDGRMRGVGARCQGGGRLVHPAGAHRVGGQGLCGLRACRAPFAHARLRFFLGPQGQRACDDRPRAHGRAAAAAREAAAGSEQQPGLGS